MTTRIAGGLLLGCNPKEPRPGTQVPGLNFVQARLPLDSWRARQTGGSAYFPLDPLENGSSYSFTLSLSSAMSALSCSLMYFAIVDSFSPTVLT